MYLSLFLKKYLKNWFILRSILLWRTNYRQLVFEIERRRGFKNKVILLAISAIGGGIKEVLKELENMFEKDDLCEKIVAEMQKTIYMESESIIRKVVRTRPKLLNKFMIIVAQWAIKLLGSPSIWLHNLKWKHSYNLHNNNDIYLMLNTTQTDTTNITTSLINTVHKN